MNVHPAHQVRIGQFVLATLFSVALCFVWGCEKKTTSVDEAQAVKADIPDDLSLLVIGDSELGMRIKRQWSARRDGQITIQNQTVSEFESADFAVL